MEPPADITGTIFSSIQNGTRLSILVGFVLILLALIGLIIHSYQPRNYRSVKAKHNPESDEWGIPKRLAISFWQDFTAILLFILLFLSFDSLNTKGLIQTWIIGVLVLGTFFFLPGPESKRFQRILEAINLPIKKLNALVNKSTDEQKDLIVKELEQVLENSDGENTEEDQKMLHGIVKFSNTTVQQIMTHITEVISINEKDGISEVVSVIRNHGYSRIPVYSSHGDKIIGILHSKDLIEHIDNRSFNWQSLIRVPFFVSNERLIMDLLEDFQQHKKHLAIVQESAGSYLGMATLDDIMEEIVGDISDEYDEEEVLYSRIDEQNYIFEARTQLTEVGKILNTSEYFVPTIEEGIQTISGLLISLCGRLPKKNEKITFHELTFTVEAVDKKHVKRVKITLDK